MKNIKNWQKRIIVLFAIVLLGCFLRIHNISNVPPSASLDEASIGWNAYSILKTGSDEYSYNFPVLLRAFDDWRPALYVYLVIPFIYVLGLGVESVRLPSILMSIFVVVGTYFLVKELFINYRYKNVVAIISSSLLTISPWHIYISRLGHEVNAGSFTIVFAILFALKYLNNTRKIFFLFLSSVLFALSMYTYQSEKIFVPLIILSIALIHKNRLLKLKKQIFFAGVLFLILIIPIILASFSPGALIRLKGTSAFSDNSLYHKSALMILKHKEEGNIIGEILSNRRFVPVKIFAQNYVAHYNPKFLFSNSGQESFRAPGFGLMYTWESIFLVIGIVFLLKRIEMKAKLLIVLWIIIAFIPSSIATGAPHAMRSFNIIPIPQILTALGVFGIFGLSRRYFSEKITKLFFVLLLLVIVYSFSSFAKQYFLVFPRTQSSSFQYSLNKTIEYVVEIEDKYDKVVFSNRDNLYQSYMFYLFYSKYDSFEYRSFDGTTSGGFDETHKFSKYEFRPIAWEADKKIKNTLFVGNLDDFPEGIESIEDFSNLDGKGIIKIVKN